jgi:hypothetical protein
MPMPKRKSVDDFFAQLNDVQRPHLEALRALSLDADPEAREELKWNLPVYVRGGKTDLWMLQNFKSHCSLRFSPPFFATQKSAVGLDPVPWTPRKRGCSSWDAHVGGSLLSTKTKP